MSEHVRLRDKLIPKGNTSYDNLPHLSTPMFKLQQGIFSFGNSYLLPRM
jgi:hypothetical protein